MLLLQIQQPSLSLWGTINIMGYYGKSMKKVCASRISIPDSHTSINPFLKISEQANISLYLKILSSDPKETNHE